MKSIVGRSCGELFAAAIIALPLIFPIAPPTRAMPYSALGAPVYQPITHSRLIGDEESGAHLLLGFADRSGSYLANVLVIVVDQSSHGIVASLVTEGPWLDLLIEPGVYAVKAVFQGEEQELRDLQLARYDRILRMLYWDLNVPPTEMQARALGTLA